MGRRHKGDVTENHPSLNCYRHHGCRCAGCGALNTERVAQRRLNLSEGQRRRRAAERELAAGHTETPTRRVRRSTIAPLPPDELARLRRAVGLIE